MTQPDDGSESTTTRWIVSGDRRVISGDVVVVVVVVVDVDVSPIVASRARHITTCCRGRCTTELHRFFDALANTTDTNDPRPTTDLKVRGCANDTECCPNWNEDAGERVEEELNQREFELSMIHERKEIDRGSRNVCRANDVHTDFPRRAYAPAADTVSRGLAESLIFLGHLRRT